MEPVIQIGAVTDVGQVREHNEDSVLAHRFPLGHPWGLSALLLVADGVGGRDAGEVASRLGLETLWRWFGEPCLPPPVSGAGMPRPSMITAALHTAIQDANAAVRSAAGQGGSPASTLTVCLIRPGEVFIGHVGDSRAYLITGKEIIQLTDDDSLVADAVRRGQMTPEEARHSPYRNQILKALGVEDSIAASVHQHSLPHGAALLVCSDGLSEYVDSDELREVFFRYSVPQDACVDLVRLANVRGGHDNISVAVLYNGPLDAKSPQLPRNARPTGNRRNVTPALPTPALTNHLAWNDPTILLRSLFVVLMIAFAIVLGAYLAHRNTRREPTAPQRSNVHRNIPTTTTPFPLPTQPDEHLPEATPAPEKTSPLPKDTKKGKQRQQPQPTAPEGEVNTVPELDIQAVTPVLPTSPIPEAKEGDLKINFIQEEKHVIVTLEGEGILSEENDVSDIDNNTLKIKNTQIKDIIMTDKASGRQIDNIKTRKNFLVELNHQYSLRYKGQETNFTVQNPVIQSGASR